MKIKYEEINRKSIKAYYTISYTLHNVETLYEATNNVNKVFDDYSTIASEAKHVQFYGKGFKILTHTQMLQRLPIALAQVKAGNTSKNLLNETCQIIYLLYRAKEITKSVYNNIMKRYSKRGINTKCINYL